MCVYVDIYINSISNYCRCVTFFFFFRFFLCCCSYWSFCTKNKVSCLPRKTPWQSDWKHLKRRDFVTSPIDTAKPQENQRLETRHVGAAKQAFRARIPLILSFSTRYQTGWNATPATQNDMTTCLKTFEKERFCNFRHRHGEATEKPETREETRGRSKTSISCETSANLTLCSFKIDVFLRVSLGASKFFTSKPMFHTRLPSIFSTSHKMPRLPRNLHPVATWRSPANAICKRHATRHV